MLTLCSSIQFGNILKAEFYVDSIKSSDTTQKPVFQDKCIHFLPDKFDAQIKKKKQTSKFQVKNLLTPYHFFHFFLCKQTAFFNPLRSAFQSQRPVYSSGTATPNWKPRFWTDEVLSGYLKKAYPAFE